MNRTLIFDGACGFCTRSAEWALSRAREPFAAVPYQATSVDRYGLTIDQARETAWWVEDNLQVEGHRAVARVLMHCRGAWPVLGRLLLVPPVSWLASVGYALVSRVRHRLPGVAPAVDGDWDPFDGRPQQRHEAHAHA